ncbi:hypothetical protein [Streptomyces sp. PT12]|uniref:hypothetical protein n=1 Tax=Streptomyces sp. PT12 TaxID=1510197 RepID=UPI000DE22A2B|nr:hypothetical protein [Streptomyces sp. PT12]RBM23313.1 hypothetical protein DEH69_03080 [Streptomyces sp. PT12]
MIRECPDPALRHLRPGTLMAWWAVDPGGARGAGEGRAWVRRDCLWPDLVRYYEEQGFTLFHEVERDAYRLFMLGRRAERVETLPESFRAGAPGPGGRPRLPSP